MSTFFSTYPKTVINNRLITDLTARAAIRQKYSDRLSIYYPYALQEGDTPEIIAAKYYGDPERHWIVMLANDTINPFFDFTLDYQVFEKHLNSKYANEANSVNQWANSTWRGEWDANEYINIEGADFLASNTTITYNEDHTIEYIHNNDTGVTYTVIEGSPQDIDITNTYFVANTVVVSNTAFICNKMHTPTVFLEDLKKNYWTRILDGVYWKGEWQDNTDYNKDDVVRHNNTIYICTQNNLDNANNNIIVSNANYWKTYSNGVEYALVTNYGYKATTSIFDSNVNATTENTIFIDKKAYNGGENGYELPILNYASQVKQLGNITETTSKERISIYEYEHELNENKREIKLIREEYVPQLEQELKILMETYYG